MGPRSKDGPGLYHTGFRYEIFLSEVAHLWKALGCRVTPSDSGHSCCLMMKINWEGWQKRELVVSRTHSLWLPISPSAYLFPDTWSCHFTLVMVGVCTPWRCAKAPNQELPLSLSLPLLRFALAYFPSFIPPPFLPSFLPLYSFSSSFLLFLTL